jgi:beta-glucuronidase
MIKVGAGYKTKLLCSFALLSLLVTGCGDTSSSTSSSSSKGSNSSLENMSSELGPKYESLPKDKVLPLSVGTSSLAMTMDLKDGIPYQNEIVYPSFNPQDSLLIDLSGKWYKRRIINLDASKKESLDVTFEGRSQDLINRYVSESQGYIRGEFNRLASDTISLPLPENKLYRKVAADGVEKYEMGTWYYREFELDEKTNDSYIFKSLGSNYITDVFVNGMYVGYHEGGHSPFAFDITNYVFKGTNSITLRVHGIPFGSRSDTIPGDIQGTDYFNYTGPMQLMYIERLPLTHIARVDVTSLSTLDGFNVSVVIENEDNKTNSSPITYKLYEADQSKYLDAPDAKSIIGELVLTGTDIETTVAANKDIKKNFVIKVDNPKLWDVNDPNLYVLEVSYNNQVHYSQVGLRTIKSVGTHLYLNDVDTFFAGVARHEESMNYGRTFNWETLINDLNGIKELGATFLRTGHYPNQIYTYILLDRYGIASGVELPIWQNDEDSYKRIVKRGIGLQLWREMIFSNYNSPSIIFWSTQNEAGALITRTQLNQILQDDIKNNYNDGRIVMQSAAADRPGPNDSSTAPLDAAGYTLYFETFHGDVAYGGTKKFLVNTRNNSGSKDKPAINTEYGYWADDDRIFRTLQADLEYATVNKDGTINENGFMACVVYWTYADWYVNHQQHIQGMGLTSLSRNKKNLYYKLKGIYLDLMQNNGKAINSAVKDAPVTKYTHNLTSTNGEFSITSDELNKYNYIVLYFNNDMYSEKVNLTFTGKSSYFYKVDTVFKEVKIPTSYFVPYMKQEGTNDIIFNFSTNLTNNFVKINLED